MPKFSINKDVKPKIIELSAIIATIPNEGIKRRVALLAALTMLKSANLEGLLEWAIRA